MLISSLTLLPPYLARASVHNRERTTGANGQGCRHSPGQGSLSPLCTPDIAEPHYMECASICHPQVLWVIGGKGRRDEVCGKRLSLRRFRETYDSVSIDDGPSSLCFVPPGNSLVSKLPLVSSPSVE